MVTVSLSTKGLLELQAGELVLCEQEMPSAAAAAFFGWSGHARAFSPRFALLFGLLALARREPSALAGLPLLLQPEEDGTVRLRGVRSLRAFQGTVSPRNMRQDLINHLLWASASGGVLAFVPARPSSASTPPRAPSGPTPSTAPREDGLCFVPAPGEITITAEARESLLARLSSDYRFRREDGEDAASEPLAEEVGTSELPPISAPAYDATHFFGRSREIAQLFEWWQPLRMASACLIGPRGAGKSSLLRQLAQRCAAPDPAQPAAPPRLVLLDLEDPRHHSLGGALSQLCRSLGLPAEASASFDDFLFAAETQISDRVVIAIDHVDVALRGSGGLGDLFFDGLRALVSDGARGRIALLVATREDPLLLARQGRQSSSLFNIMRALHVGPLEEAEARALLAASGLRAAARDRAFLLEHSERWPRPLLIGLDHLAQALRQGERSDQWREPALREMLRHLPVRRTKKGPPD